MDPGERRAARIAAAVTFAAALIILVLLFVLSVGDSRRQLADNSMPEIDNNEEIFLEPELLVLDNPGDEDSPLSDEPAPSPDGVPDKATEEQPLRKIPDSKPDELKPKSNKAEMVASPAQSDVKSPVNTISAEEEKRIASMQGKLKTDNNGSIKGKESDASGSGGDGVSASGSLNGRKMISCPTWKVRLTQKTTVKVNITVDAAGNVTSASAVSGGTPNLRRECEKMAKGSKWTKKAGASPASGSISFTITPA